MRLRHDQVILALTLALLIVGLGMVFSASARYSDGVTFLQRQLVNACVGVAAMLAISSVDYRRWMRVSRLALVVAVALLGVLFFVDKIRGANNWLPFLGRSLQPSEFARLALVLFLAGEIAAAPERLRSFRHGFLPLVLVIGGLVLLVVLQNDFGGGLALGLISMSLLYVGGARILHLLASGAVLLGGAVAFAMHRPHVLERVSAFLHPDEHALGFAYQSLQSVLHIGSGGLFGKGLGQGVAKYGYLPDPHTDFIFSILGEELGFVGCVVVLGLFLLLIARGVRVARSESDAFGRLLAAGVAMSLFWFLALNVCVATRLFPVTGLPLPLISYGGSSMVSHLVAIGMLRNIAMQLEPSRRPVRAWMARRRVLDGAL